MPQAHAATFTGSPDLMVWRVCVWLAALPAGLGHYIAAPSAMGRSQSVFQGACMCAHLSGHICKQVMRAHQCLAEEAGQPFHLRWANVTVAAERRERRPVIEQVGRELLEVNAEGLEQVEGHRVVELLATTPVVPLEEPASADLNGSAPPSTPALHVRSTALRSRIP